MGIEPTSPAWKAGVIAIIRRPRAQLPSNRYHNPLFYFSLLKSKHITIWWRGLDLNQRRHSQRVYSPSLLTTQAPLQYDIHRDCSGLGTMVISYPKKTSFVLIGDLTLIVNANPEYKPQIFYHTPLTVTSKECMLRKSTDTLKQRPKI